MELRKEINNESELYIDILVEGAKSDTSHRNFMELKRDSKSSHRSFMELNNKSANSNLEDAGRFIKLSSKHTNLESKSNNRGNFMELSNRNSKSFHRSFMELNNKSINSNLEGTGRVIELSSKYTNLKSESNNRTNFMELSKRSSKSSLSSDENFMKLDKKAINSSLIEKNQFTKSIDNINNTTIANEVSEGLFKKLTNKFKNIWDH